MSKSYAFGSDNLSKYYIIKNPTKLSDIDDSEMYDDVPGSWQEKSRRLQARRWRKIKHQLI